MLNIISGIWNNLIDIIVVVPMGLEKIAWLFTITWQTWYFKRKTKINKSIFLNDKSRENKD